MALSIVGSRPEFIKNYKDLMDEDNATYPGRRTSWPHAESEEEEFAYVIEGHPQAWIDGEIYDLSPGDFVAFPSGTGIAHTFINNTELVVLMLVGGEATKKDNKIFYPLHPDRNEEMKSKGAFWDNHPVKELGIHDGLPDKKRKV